MLPNQRRVRLGLGRKGAKAPEKDKRTLTENGECPYCSLAPDYLSRMKFNVAHPGYILGCRPIQDENRLIVRGRNLKVNETKETALTGVQETLLLPLWGRAVEVQKKKPLLIDEKAVEIVNRIPYDLSTLTKKMDKTAHLGFIARGIYFDGRISKFISAHPDATIVNIGCGLDTTFNRVDNGKIQWIDLDFPEVIDFRRKFISESDRQIFMGKSVFDTTWYDAIKNKKELMFLIAGVLEYFSDQEIMRLFQDFAARCPGVEILFEYCSEVGLRALNKSLEKMPEVVRTARLTWSLEDISDLKKINDRISIIHAMPMYKEHRKHYPIFTRLLLSYFDLWKITSLAHIKID
jgi:O-methyltransferase involved in polyketide biosynthesis